MLHANPCKEGTLLLLCSLSTGRKSGPMPVPAFVHLGRVNVLGYRILCLALNLSMQGVSCRNGRRVKGDAIASGTPWIWNFSRSRR